MFSVKDKYKPNEILIPNEDELFDWWSFTAQDEISWNDLIKRLKAGNTVYLLSFSVRLFSPSNSLKTKQEKMCNHPNKYKNTISRTLVFWVCPDCKKDLGNG